MSAKEWLERVEHELVQRRLPRGEVARLVSELSDHLADAMESHAASAAPTGGVAVDDLPQFTLMEEPMNPEWTTIEAARGETVSERLGSPAAIAEAAVHEFRKRNLLNRSRWAAFATFVVLPVPLLALAWIATLAGIIQAGDWLGLAESPAAGLRDVTAGEVLGVHLFLVSTLLVPSALASLLFGRLARHTGRRWSWGLVACMLVALTTALATTSATFSEVPGKSTITFGLQLGRWQLSQLCQLFVPLAVGVLVLRRPAAAGKPLPG